MTKKNTARIIGLGSYLPEKVLNNKDLEQIVDTTDEWIVSRTGMKERRIAAADEFPSDMGAKAAEKALNSFGLVPEAIDMIIVATMSPDYISPSTGNLVQAKLKACQCSIDGYSSSLHRFSLCIIHRKGFRGSKCLPECPCGRIRKDVGFYRL